MRGEPAADPRPAHIAGIEEALPPGERVLWQGAPHWPTLARSAFQVRLVALYFAVLAGWRAIEALHDGRGPGSALAEAAALAPAAALGIGLLALLAWLAARTTIYAITSRRVVMRIGIALPITVNLPLRGIVAAAWKPQPDGTGELPLQLTSAAHLAYLHLWPHARPWKLAHPQPMLRAVPHAERVAALLAQALAAEHGLPAAAAEPATASPDPAAPSVPAAAAAAPRPAPAAPAVAAGTRAPAAA